MGVVPAQISCGAAGSTAIDVTSVARKLALGALHVRPPSRVASTPSRDVPAVSPSGLTGSSTSAVNDIHSTPEDIARHVRPASSLRISRFGRPAQTRSGRVRSIARLRTRRSFIGAVVATCHVLPPSTLFATPWSVPA